ncbi:MAG: GNAT family N-acetyltransferase [Planctomycetes bacterium]|nr:GNAT family N-acetyltransferase [Planctomycetota bacterium]
MTTKPDAVSLREITKDTVKSILALEVAEGQEDLVGDNGNSLAQALFEEKAWYRGIYAGDEPVGFLMLSVDREKPEFYLWRFMIDAKQQRKGYGKRAIELLIEEVRAQPEARELTLHVMDLPHSAVSFYEALGFKLTGERDGDELVMSLPL